MSCGGGHLGFPIGIKNRNLVKDIPMIIHLQFGFSQFISFSIGISFTKFLFFMPIGNPRWPPPQDID
jgi:hypothetical protein